MAEFVGLMIFQIYGGNAADEVAAFGNGITLVILGNDPVHCFVVRLGFLSNSL